MPGAFDVILTVVVLSFWFLFPLGMFLSVSHVDKNTDQIVRLEHHRHYAEEPTEFKRPVVKEYKPIPFDWHHPFAYFRRWIQQES